MSMSKEYIAGLWERAVKTIQDAGMSLSFSPDNAANRAYYAAFYAVSALFASEERFFKKHTATRAAVHKELVNTGRWNESLGDDYDKLLGLREVADYGVLQHTSPEEAREAIEQADRVLHAVHEARPDLFPIDTSS